MRALAATLLLMALAVAGCATKVPPATSSTGTSTSASATHAATTSATASSAPTSATSAPTNGTTPLANAPPTATLVAHNATGAAPFNVTFALGGTDPDGDALNWTLTYGDGNQTAGGHLPANATHTYGAVGNFTVRLTVTDGAHRVNATLVVKATAVAAAAAVTSQAFSASYGFDNPACAGGPYDALPNSEPTGLIADYLTYAKLAVDPGTIGQPFTASFASGAAEDTAMFLNAAGKTVKSFGAGLIEGGWDVAGVVPAGSAFVVFYGCGNLAGETVTYGAGPE